MRKVYGDTGKISTRQVFFISAMIAVVYASRFTLTLTATREGPTAWLSPFISVIVLALIFLIFNSLYRSFQGMGPVEVLKMYFGKGLGMVFSAVLLIWMTFLIAFITRLYSERAVTIFFPNADINIFTFFFALVAGFFVHFKPVIIARVGEIIFAIIFVIFIFSFLALFGLVDVNHLLPVAPKSVPTLLYCGIGCTGVWGFGLYTFFLTDHIDYNKVLKKRSYLYYSAFVLLFTVLIQVTTIGVLGASLTGKAILPFNDAIKVVTLFDTFNRLEVFFTVIVDLVDYVTIAFYVFIALSLLKGIFHLQDTKPFIWVYVLFIAVLSNAITKSYFELEPIVRNILTLGNLAFMLGLPFLMLVVGKLRKVI
ncbi:MAG: GerAB/ArcD/ProY family transporter [Bacillota bacterium]|nr:GerAB/ArcD/ProY family transporter [Bacillota bacterium]